MHPRTHGRRRARVASVSVALIAALLGTLLGSTTQAGAAARKALINGATVVGAPSQEEQIASALGFDVTVVDDATWGSMTAADFGQYDLLIAGDPSCGSLPAGLISSAPVFGPVVLGMAGGRTSAGNRVLVGTDPVFHDGGDYTSPDARGTIIREGIAFAGAHPGRTGMYFDATCAGSFQGSEILDILKAISAGTGSWTINGSPPCGGSVSLIAAHPAFTDLSTTSLQGWFCSVHESFPTFTSDWTALAVATDTDTKPTCGVDPDTGASACGEAYILIAGSGIVTESLVLSVTPLDATNPVGATHTVTANVHDASGSPPVAGQLVDFTVTGVNGGATGTCVPADCKSDSSGNVSFTYTDTGGPGDDTIKASFTDTAGSLQTATAQKHWVTGAHQLIVGKAGTGTGAVTSSPAGIDCGATCSATFPSGTVVTLTAVPDATSTFVAWTGDCTGTGSCSVTMDADRSVSARFESTKPPGNAKGLKQDALDSLQSLLPTGDAFADRKIAHAIDEIGDSLKAKFWVDDSHLTALGRRVFAEEKDAVQALRRIPSPPPGVGDAVDMLLDADRMLSKTAVDEAAVAGGDPTLLAKARKALQNAEDAIAAGRIPDGIELFGRAWKLAMQA